MNVRSIFRATVAIAILVVNSVQSGAAASRHPQRGSNVGTANAYPREIATAPDGSLWFGENRGIEHLLPSGQFHLFAVPGAAGAYGDNTPGSLVVDARGTVWFTAGQHIGRLDGAGVLRMISVPVRLGGPALITKSPDGTMWCVFENDGFRSYGYTIARISPDGRVHPVFTWPKRGSIPGSVDRLEAVAVGKGDRIWFADTFVTNYTQGSGPSFVGYLDSHMKIVRLPMPIAIPGVCPPDECIPSSILIGKVGTVWIGLIGSALGQVTTKGVWHISVLPRSVIIVADLAPGSDGSVWFSAIGAGIGHVSRDGLVKFFVVSRTRTEAYDSITATPDGSLWFTIGCENGIGHITTTGVIRVFHIPGTIADAGEQCPELP